MKGSVSAISIPVSDQEKAKDFYQHTLGFDLVADNPWGASQRWITLSPGGGEAAISLVNWFEQMPPGSLQGLVLTVENVEEVRGALQEKGVSVSPLEEQPSGTFAMFRDLDGNGWILREALGSRSD